MLKELLEQRKSLIDALAALVEKRQGERAEFEKNTDPSDEERSAFAGAETAFDTEFQAKRSEISDLDRRIDEQELLERRQEEAARASRGSVSVVSEPLTYRSDNARDVSYFRDLACATVPGLAARMEGNPADAQKRLDQHAAEMAVELPKRDEARERRAQTQIDRAEREFTGSVVGMRRRGLDESPFERRVNPNRTDGQGGYFVPPLWLVDQYIPGLRAGRVAAGLCRQMDLPAGTDSINIPKLSTLTATAIQTADGQAVNSQDFTDTAVTAGVKTIAGQEDISLQLLEQSPGQIMDQVIIEDLTADYNQKVDQQVLTGTGSNGQVTGVLPDTNWTANKITWTSASPLGPGYNMALGAMASKVSYKRYNLQNLHFLMHPRRWFWFATALDGASGTSGRPIVSADGFGPYNASAVDAGGGVPAEGLAGRVPFGPNAYIDGNVPVAATAAGAVTGGTNDLVVAAKWDDLWLFEGSLRTRVLPEILSGTLQVRFQVYNYVAFLARYGESIAVAVGTGLAAPASALDSSVTF